MTLKELESHIEDLADSILEARQEAPSMVKGIRAEIQVAKYLIAARKAGVKPAKMARKTKARPYAEFHINWLTNYVTCAKRGYAGYTDAEAIKVQAEITARC